MSNLRPASGRWRGKFIPSKALIPPRPTRGHSCWACCGLPTRPVVDEVRHVRNCLVRCCKFASLLERATVMARSSAMTAADLQVPQPADQPMIMHSRKLDATVEEARVALIKTRKGAEISLRLRAFPGRGTVHLGIPRMPGPATLKTCARIRTVPQAFIVSDVLGVCGKLLPPLSALGGANAGGEVASSLSNGKEVREAGSRICLI